MSARGQFFMSADSKMRRYHEPYEMFTYAHG